MFRNEVMDTVPQELTVDWFVKVPRRGILRYVCKMALPADRMVCFERQQILDCVSFRFRSFTVNAA